MDKVDLLRHPLYKYISLTINYVSEIWGEILGLYIGICNNRKHPILCSVKGSVKVI